MYHKNSPTTIQSLFNQIANRYDLTNAIISLSLHTWWNRALIRHLNHANSQNVFLDLCSGTGDIAFKYLQKKRNPNHAYLIDFSSKMLELAKKKEEKFTFLSRHTLFYLESDVQNLPLTEHFADCAAMAYGIRNVQDPGLCLQEVFRVLKPGGCFGILELTRPKNSFLNLGHQFYLKILIPFIGKWLAANKEAYQYLCNSIQTFIDPRELEDLMKLSGFTRTKQFSLNGGIATILIGYKPISFL